MKDDAKATIVGAILTFALIVGLFSLWYWANIISRSPTAQAAAVPQFLSEIEASAEAKIPGVDKATLKDTGGGSKSGTVYRRIEKNIFQVAIIADLPDPPARSFYQGWLAQGNPKDANYTVHSLGQMQRDESGHWFVEEQSAKNQGNLWQVYVTEEKAFDGSPEKYILSGKLPVRL